jgi:hypothetical protein
MTKLVQYSILIFSGLLIISCDCLQQASGTVLDSDTKLPIDSVIISRYFNSDTVIEWNRNFYTDESGNFEFTGMAGGLFGCPKIKLEIEKTGYENIIKKYRSCCTKNDTIYLKKVNN